MKIKTSELTGAALNWAVANCEGQEVFIDVQMGYLAQDNSLYTGASDLIGPTLWQPTADWAQGGPIIERERIWLKFPFGDVGEVEAIHGFFGFPNIVSAQGSAALIAAMRCYAASKLGDEVDVPDELCEQAIDP